MDCAFPCAVIKPYSYDETKVFVNGTDAQALKDYYKYFAVAPDGTQNYVMTEEGKIAKRIGTKFKPDAIGDVVFSDGSATSAKYAENMGITLTTTEKSKAVGIIFYVGKDCSNDGATSRMLGVGMVQKDAEMQWCDSSAKARTLSITDNICNSSGNYQTGITFTGDVDGSDNLTKMASHLASNSVDDTGTSGKYPPFDYCSTYSSLSGTHLSGTSYTSGWYLPSAAEAYKMVRGGISAKKAFELCGATPITLGTNYISSSQYSSNANNFLYVQSSTSESIQSVSHESKFTSPARSWSVRPIREF
ncbi:MAG: hypothetical protein IK094_01765 [Treponema sp.]|nr:hypothetical protein [Treponema sp.]